MSNGEWESLEDVLARLKAEAKPGSAGSAIPNMSVGGMLSSNAAQRADAGSGARDSEKVNNLTYEQWMKKVNNSVILIAGVSEADLGDWSSWDSWNSGATPLEGAHEALEGSDFPFED